MLALVDLFLLFVEVRAKDVWGYRGGAGGALSRTFMKKAVSFPFASVALILAVRAQYEAPLALMPVGLVPGGSSRVAVNIRGTGLRCLTQTHWQSPHRPRRL